MEDNDISYFVLDLNLWIVSQLRLTFLELKETIWKQKKGDILEETWVLEPEGSAFQTWYVAVWLWGELVNFCDFYFPHMFGDNFCFSELFRELNQQMYKTALNVVATK